MKNASIHWIMSNKFVLMTFIPTMIFLALSHRVVAKDPGLCFMVTSSGKTISLDKLCGVTLDQTVAQIPTKIIRSKAEVTQIQSISKVPNVKLSRIPIKRRIGQTPVIEVSFNNKQKFDMILDTGANSTLITRAMANQLQIKPTGNMEAQVADGSQIKLLTGHVKYMAVGKVVVNNIEVAIAPNAPIGLLGHDFFGNYDIKLLANEVEFQRR
jgi:predicted aspartyl protease